ncbi:protease [Amycolatopsis antarctica]|uniref:Protease n=1 Tax=Amycolatopsis antarctica TaxID=1854586 RepID=A0A263D756_9PSEU|nr:SSI family serine proteinase inhibitor [Amycolatopsis antarctica]OZM74300.1 protease [Amycolatopsis antarctica]
MPFLETVTACALTLACSGGPTAPAGHHLTLTMQEPDGQTSAVVLECEPSGGSHPTPDTACETLTAVAADFAGIAGEQRQCILLYSPVEVQAVGRWQGERVNFQASYANRCVAGAQTSGVFDF